MLDPSAVDVPQQWKFDHFVLKFGIDGAGSVCIVRAQHFFTGQNSLNVLQRFAFGFRHKEEYKYSAQYAKSGKYPECLSIAECVVHRLECRCY